MVMSDKESSDGSHGSGEGRGERRGKVILFYPVTQIILYPPGIGAAGERGGGRGRGAGAGHQDAADSEQEVLPGRQGEQAGQVHQGEQYKLHLFKLHLLS